MTTTAAATNIATEDFPISMEWNISVNPIDSNSPVQTPTPAQLSITTFASQSLGDNCVAFYTFGGTVQGISSNTDTVCGVYMLNVLAFCIEVSGNLYTFAGLCMGNNFAAGLFFEGDPTDEGSWSGTAQGTGHGSSSNVNVGDLFGKSLLDLLGNGSLKENSAGVATPAPASV